MSKSPIRTKPDPDPRRIVQKLEHYVEEAINH